MRILVSNDDGVHAEGLRVLAEVSRAIADVTVVAPDREQSGASHSLTLARPLRPVQRSEDVYQVDGTPTDCVLLALNTLLDTRPDFVFSGVNIGPNMGEDVLYSGTVAAAMEGLAAGIPSVAFSFAGGRREVIESQRSWIERLARDIVTVDAFPEDTLLNINLPPVPGDEIEGIRVTTLGSRVFEGSIAKTKDPWGRIVYWIGGGHISWSGREDSDFRAIRDRHISVTPLHVDLTNYGLLEAVRAWGLGE